MNKIPCKIENGLIPKGYACPYSDECGASKFIGNDGEWDQCPVANKIHTIDYSCGMARAYHLINHYK